MKFVNSDSVVSIWQKRGLIKDITNKEFLKKVIDHQKSVYCGIDPTADSLHIGHLVPLILLKEIGELGCQPIILLGGSTAQIGDPSFRSKKRAQLSIHQIEQNTKKIHKQIQQLLPNSKIINNKKWYDGLTYLDFLKKVGTLFTVNKMLQKESFSFALERNELFYDQLSYILLQAYDFYCLWQQEECYLQIGGSDQFPNIVFGIELVRRLSGDKVFCCGVTTNLLLDKKAKKISKTSDEQIWLDQTKTPIFDMYQFFYNLSDELTISWNNIFCDCSLFHTKKKLPTLAKETRSKQKHLFFHIISWLFGVTFIDKFNQLLNVLTNSQLSESAFYKFKKTFFLSNYTLSLTQLNLDIVNLLMQINLVNSKGQGLRLIKQKAIKVNHNLINSNILCQKLWTPKNNVFVVQKGKKKQVLVLWK